VWTAVALQLVVPVAVLVAADRADEQVVARAGPPPVSEVTQVDLAFDVDTGQAGGSTVVRIVLRDAAGREADAPLQLLADGGVVEQPARARPGVYSARVALSPVLGAKRALMVTASAGSGTASATLPLVPGPPALLRVDPPGDLAADGTAHLLWFTVSDAYGNPSPEVPHVEALRGSVSDQVSIQSGSWMVTYRPPRDTRRSEDVLRLVAGPAASTTTLPLDPMVPTLSVGARAGAVLGTDKPAIAFGAEVVTSFKAGPLDLGLAVAATWWSVESRGEVRSSGGVLDLRARHAWLPLTLSAALRHTLGARVVGTLSVGGGAALVTSRTTLTGQPAVSEAGWAPVASAGLELALRQRLGEVVAGAQGAWIGDARLDTVTGTARAVFLHLGYRFHAL
jgi:hypothetical protein